MNAIKSFARGFLIAMPGACFTAPMTEAILKGDHKKAMVAAAVSIACNVVMVKAAGNSVSDFNSWNKAESIGYRVGSWGVAAILSAHVLNKELAKR